jgi:DNA-binding transcriptional MerR regulator
MVYDPAWNEEQPMTYTVRQLAHLAGVTPRTLRHYDAVGLLRPSSVGDNGYRYYDDASALRLQQILFFRELDLSLDEIRAVLDAPEFQTAPALEKHRRALQARVARLNGLIHTIDRTVLHLKGQIEMSTKELFEGFDDETQARYEEEAAQLYDPRVVQESGRRWKSYTAEEKARIRAEGGAVYQDLLPLLDRDPTDDEVQVVVARWHEHLRAFYEPTPDILRGLGRAYAEDARFAAFFGALHPDLPGFFSRAIEYYVTEMEDRS